MTQNLKKAIRRLSNDISVVAKKYDSFIHSANRSMVIAGVFGVRPGVDSIALDQNGEWLYYASVSDPEMFRVRTKDLNDLSLDEKQLSSRVETYANKTMSDGIIMDESFIYIPEMEHSSVIGLRLSEDPKGRTLETFYKDPKLLRWPDGLSFAPNDKVYLACSALQHIVMKTTAHMNEHSPYHIFRFNRPGGRKI